MYYEVSPVEIVKSKTRHVLREMLICGVIVAGIIALSDARPLNQWGVDYVFALAVAVIVISLPAWLIYRLVRFLVGI